METAGESYRQHRVWQTLALKREALETSRFSREDYEAQRVQLISLLKTAEKSKPNVQPYIYDGTLDRLADWANGISADESGLQNHVARSGGLNALAELVRNLPGPPPRNIPAHYLETLDAAISAREQTLANLSARTAAVEQALSDAEQSLLRIASDATAAKDSAETSSNQAQTSADALQDELRRIWDQSTKEWESERATAREADDKIASEHVGVLANAAALGDRLLEHTTGTLVAKDWSERANRERRAGYWLRVLGIMVLVGAALVGGWVVDRALQDGFDLTLGDGVLRASLVAAIGGLGAAMLVESRRHYREADSSEEIALALTALEPYFAGDDQHRSDARKALGEAIFVSNVLSRFAHRDASKHADVSSLSISSVTDAVAKVSETLKNTKQAGG